jgi:hypothetical protein
MMWIFSQLNIGKLIYVGLEFHINTNKIYITLNTSVDTEMCCPKGKCGCQYFILLTIKKKKNHGLRGPGFF